jgi:hypothetical protein
MTERFSIGAAVMLLAAVTLACGKRSPPTPGAVEAGTTSAVASAPSPKPKRAPIAVADYGKDLELKSLLDDYRTNELRADSLYKGKRFVFSGKIGVVKKGILDRVYATVGLSGTLFERPLVQAFFESSETSQLESLSAGTTVRISCEVKGLSFNVLAERCSFVHGVSADLLCHQLIEDGLATTCAPQSDPSQPTIDVQSFESASGLKGAVYTLQTDDDFLEEQRLEESDRKTDPKVAKLTIARSRRVRAFFAIDKTALQSEKDALQAFVDAL